jgi:hypothetical protein
MRAGRTVAQFGTPTKTRDAPARSVKGRHCVEAGCPTVLSTYNPSATCWLHSAPSMRHPLAHD